MLRTTFDRGKAEAIFANLQHSQPVLPVGLQGWDIDSLTMLAGVCTCAAMERVMEDNPTFVRKTEILGDEQITAHVDGRTQEVLDTITECFRLANMMTITKAGHDYDGNYERRVTLQATEEGGCSVIEGLKGDQ